MSGTERSPIYNLKAVVQETGLKPDTLRAWERRYDLPNPQRTASGHRLYSQRDVEIVKWLVERQHEGLTIQRAVDLWRQLENGQDDPLAGSGHLSGSTAPAAVQDSAVFALRAEENSIADLRRLWVSACLRFDERSAEQSLSQAFALFTVETVCSHVLQRGLAEIGDGWHQGRVTVQQEHFASALAIRRLEAMLASTAVPYRSGRIIIGCPPEEEHTFVPVILSLLLRRRGFDVVYLGANIPLRSMEATIDTTEPTLAILVAQQLGTAATLLEMAQVLAVHNVPTAYGGLVFRTLPELTRVIPGYYLGDSLDGSIQAVEQIMLNPKVQPAARRPSALHLAAHDHFRLRQADVEAQLWHEAIRLALPTQQLAAANAYLGRTLSAALRLGNLNLLSPDLDWIESLLVNHFQLPVDRVDHYLQLYYNALSAKLDARGDEIVTWFARLIGVTPARARLQSPQLSNQ